MHLFKCFNKSLFFISFLLMMVFSAARADHDFYADQRYAATLKDSSKGAVSSFNPTDVFKGYSPHPDVSTNLDHADEVAAQSQTGSLINKDFKNKQGSYPMNLNSPEMQQANLIEKNATAISEGKNNAYVNCEQKQVNCILQIHNETCSESTTIDNLSCHERLVIHVNEHAAITQKITVHVASYARDHTNFTIDLKNGKLIASEGAQSADLKISPWAYDIDCATSSVVYNNDEQYWNDPDLPGEYWTDRVYLTQPSKNVSCKNPIVTVSFDQGHQHYWRKRGISFSYNLTYVPRPTFTDEWIKDCSGVSTLIDGGLCHQTSSICTAGEATHIIDQFPITRDCWERDNTFSCQGNLQNTCADLKAKNCTQVYSECSLKIGDMCLGYKQTYACQDQVCLGSGIICGSDFFCMKGECSIVTPTQSQNMGQAISEVSAVNAAAEDVKQQQSQVMDGKNIPVFSGRAMQCSDDMAGFSNCCRDSGWGQDIHLAHCTEEEQILGAAREKQLALSVGGSYCSHEVAGVCVAHKKSFCVFDTKMALDVQRDGREKQLHISFGDAKDPNCRGLSVDELKSLDFTQIDLSNIVDDLKNNMNLPDAKEIKQKALDEIARKQTKMQVL